MKEYLQKIDWQTSGNRCDVTPLFADPKLFDACIKDLVKPFRAEEIDQVACIDALGFILGTAVARELGLGIVPVRKGGKLPVETDSVTFVDYSGQTKQLEMRSDALYQSQRVLVVDEWIETGAQVQAAIQLIEKQGAVIVGIACINIDSNKQTKLLRQSHFIHSLTP